MSLWKIAWRSIQQRSLPSALTAFSMSLGVALVVAVLVIHGVVNQSFNRSAQGFNLVVGAKGSRLELVLGTIFHIGRVPGTMPYYVYDELANGPKYAGDVELAIPICLGDTFKTFRVIGTSVDMFDRLEYSEGKKYEFEEGGRNFAIDRPFEAVVGATVAYKTGLKIGDTFSPVHGDRLEKGVEHDPFTVVGILKPTGTPNDRAVFVNAEGFYHSHPAAGEAHKEKKDADKKDAKKDEHAGDKKGAKKDAKKDDHAGEKSGDKHADHDHGKEEHAGHDHANGGKDDHDHADRDHAKGGKDEHADHVKGGKDSHDHAKAGDDAHEGHDHGALSDDKKMVSAVLLVAKPLSARTVTLPKRIAQDLDVQAVAPAQEITNLFEGIIGNIQRVLLFLAVLIVVVAGIGILVSIYNSMNDRRHEIAVMRALGARRVTVMTVVVFESILLALGGGAIGVVLGHGFTAALSPLIADQIGVTVNAFQFQTAELVLIPGLVLLASIVGFLPAVVAYRTDVAQSLISSP